jgi:hypothetical protein
LLGTHSGLQMIAQEMIDGRPALVAYLDEDGSPAATKEAPRVKVIYDDGEIVFAVRSDAGEPLSRWPRPLRPGHG